MSRFNPKMALQLFEAVGGSNKKLPPVIFLHAMLANQCYWQKIPQRVAEGTKRKVYTYDARNHGSSGFSEDCGFQYNLQDLYEFMDQIKTNQSILVGHNMGAMTAISAALQEPKKVEKVFIVDMSVSKFPKPFLDRLILFMKRHGDELRSLPQIISKADLAGTPYEKHTPDEVAQLAPKLIRRFELLSKALKEYAQSPIVYSGQYDGPAYFIYGSHSPFEVGWDVSEIWKHFPRAEMIRFDGATHNLFQEFPDKFVDTLIKNIVD